MDKITKLDMGESFEKIPKKFHVLQSVAKVVGTLLIYFGFLFIVLSYAVSYLIEDLKEPEILFIAVFVVGWLLFENGLVICFSVTILSLPNQYKVSDYLDQYFKNKEAPKKSIRFSSFRVYRLLAAFLLLFLGFLDLFILTGKISHHQPPYGNAVFLGGPSFYYVAAFFPHGFGLGLLLFVLFKSHKVNIASSDNYFYVNDFKKNSIVNTVIPKKEIEMINYQNNNIGMNFMWVLLLLPFTIFTAINGTYFLMAPRLEDPTQAILLILTAILEIGAIFYLLLRPSNYLKITTKEYVYDKLFAPYKMKIEEIPISSNGSKGQINSDFMKNHHISSTHRNFTTLILGLFFLVSGLLMLVLYWVVGIFGNFYTSFSILFGTILLVKAVSKDFSDKNGVQINYNEETKTISFHQKFHFHFNRITTLQSTEIKIGREFRAVNFFEILLIPVLLIYSTIETIHSWALSTTSSLVLNSIITTIFLILIYVLIFVYLCFPLDQLKLKTPTITHHIPITLTERKKRFLSGVLSNDLKRPFILRCLFIALIGVLSIVGTLIYLNISFFV